MTDTTRILTVVLEEQTRTDDVSAVVDAIRMIKGVMDVDINVSDQQEYLAVSAARHALGLKILDVLRNFDKKK